MKRERKKERRKKKSKQTGLKRTAQQKARAGALHLGWTTLEARTGLPPSAASVHFTPRPLCLSLPLCAAAAAALRQVPWPFCLFPGDDHSLAGGHPFATSPRTTSASSPPSRWACATTRLFQQNLSTGLPN